MILGGNLCSFVLTVIFKGTFIYIIVINVHSDLDN
jgi:hypothetical protein